MANENHNPSQDNSGNNSQQSRNNPPLRDRTTYLEKGEKIERSE